MSNPQKILLLIRPRIPNDDYTNNFSFPASSPIARIARAQGWKVKELKENKANRVNVQNIISNTHPDFIIHYDHGGSAGLFGQSNNKSECILDDSNVNILDSAVVSTVSCSSACANGFGEKAVRANGRSQKAYLGYSQPVFADTYPGGQSYLHYFANAANAANVALLEGKDFGYAYTIGLQEHENQIGKLNALCWSKGDWRAGFNAIMLGYNKLGLACLGDRAALSKAP